MSQFDLDTLLHQMANPTKDGWKEETYDLAYAGGLTDAERSEFVARLIDAASDGDQRAILTLGHIHAVEALPTLQALAARHDPLSPDARRALVLLGHGAEIVDYIANDAVHHPWDMIRLAAVMDLPKIGGAIAIAALRQALADKYYPVRGQAWDGLVEVLDLGRHIRSPEGKLELSTEVELLRSLLLSDIAALVQLGVDEMRELTVRLIAGATPESLGLQWTPAQAPKVFEGMRLALIDPEAPFPVDEIARLTGFPRRQAETLLAFGLERQDPRVPDALVRLSATWTIPALEEVAQSPQTSPELRERLTQSIRALRQAP